jgi:hypothetical protein
MSDITRVDHLIDEDLRSGKRELIKTLFNPFETANILQIRLSNINQIDP